MLSFVEIPLEKKEKKENVSFDGDCRSLTNSKRTSMVIPSFPPEAQSEPSGETVTVVM